MDLICVDPDSQAGQSISHQEPLLSRRGRSENRSDESLQSPPRQLLDGAISLAFDQNFWVFTRGEPTDSTGKFGLWRFGSAVKR